MTPASAGDLLQAYLEGELSAEESATLEARLHSDPELCRQLLRLARDEAIVHEWAGSARQAAQKPPPSPVLRWGPLAAGLLITVLSALYFLLSELPNEPLKPTAIAQVEEVHGLVHSVVARPGQEPLLEALVKGCDLYPGQELRTRGDESFAVIRYRDSTRLELGVDTTIRLHEEAPATNRAAGHKVVLLEGILEAEAAQKARPLILSTPHFEVTAPGSKVNCWSLPRLTRIEPVQGQALVRRNSDGHSITTPSGTYVEAWRDNRVAQTKPQPVVQLRPKLSIPEESGPILALEFLPGGKQLLAGGWKGQLKVWDTATGTLLQASETGHKNQVRGLGFPTDGAWLASGSQDRMLHLWNPETLQEIRSWKPHRQGINAIAVSPDGRAIATVTGGRNLGEVKLIDVQSGIVANLVGHTSEVLAAAFSPDTRYLATAGRDRSPRIWDAHTRALLHTLNEHLEDVLTLTFSADSRTLATASRDGLVKLWDVATGKEQLAFLASPRGVRSLSFSPDGRMLATANLEPNVRLFDTTTGRESMVAKGHNYQVCVVRFSPDGRTLASGGWDRTIKVWDVPGR